MPRRDSPNVEIQEIQESQGSKNCLSKLGKPWKVSISRKSCQWAKYRDSDWVLAVTPKVLGLRLRVGQSMAMAFYRGDIT